MTIVTLWSVLLEKAKKVGQARLNKDPDLIKAAEEELKAYEKLVLLSDEMQF
jgi:hypothetical protein